MVSICLNQVVHNLANKDIMVTGEFGGISAPSTYWMDLVAEDSSYYMSRKLLSNMKAVNGFSLDICV